MTNTMPTIPTGFPGTSTYDQWPSPDGAYAPSSDWTGYSSQQFTVGSPAVRLTLTQTFFSPNGRIGRKSFWLATLITAMGYVGGAFLAVTFPVQHLQGPLFAAVFLLTLYAGTVVLIKRLHDRDYSGWFAFIHFIPLFGPIWTLAACCGESTLGANRFGVGTNPTPLG